MVSPIVSVVMSVYNGERFLREAVESILDQNFRDFEFIVINDGSTDFTGQILDSYQEKDSRMHVYHQENRGLVESLNRGCGRAQGKYIARMDADDISVINRLGWQVEFMEQHPEVGVLGGAAEIIDIMGMSLRTCANPIEDHDIRIALLDDCPIWHPTVLMRKDVFVSVGGYRKVVFGSEDYDLWLRVADHYQLANLGAVLLHYRHHPHQITVSKGKQLIFSTLAARAAATLRRDGKPDPLDSIVDITSAVLVDLGVNERIQQSALARRYLWSIGILYNNGEYSDAFNVLTEMLQTCDWKQAEKRVITDLRILAAQLHWKQRRFVKSILIAVHAAITRPIILGRPFRSLLHWFRYSN
ncbi:glycosyltransferase [Methylobacter sp. S3L5C]|uniref:glycosyltransferase n=1 Tax=Methylobacter sp. S3L5C TaxID=2839024 RepID=UPI001FAC418E|nr:glycosyltransferase [Methylobacter sp. S3L5C]UOA10200.1 glycosyltransferase [Methylobacter sp. S3L5C]